MCVGTVRKERCDDDVAPGEQYSDGLVHDETDGHDKDSGQCEHSSLFNEAGDDEKKCTDSREYDNVRRNAGLEKLENNRDEQAHSDEPHEPLAE